MNDDTRIERQLPQILADLGAGSRPDYTETILARTAAARQRPGDEASAASCGSAAPAAASRAGASAAEFHAASAAERAAGPDSGLQEGGSGRSALPGLQRVVRASARHRRRMGRHP